MKPALVILAAGASQRLGACKALVDLGGLTPLQRLLEAGSCLDGAAPLVVTGAHHDAIAAAAPRGVEVVRNAQWELGRTGGVALAASRRRGRDLAIAPVDVPLVPAEVFEALLDAWSRLGSPERAWMGPCVEVRTGGSPDVRFGHPILVGRELLRELDASGKDFPLRPDRVPIHTLRDLRRCAAEIVSVAVESAAILDDLDTPDDLERLRRRLS